jgi:hypothetical protein
MDVTPRELRDIDIREGFRESKSRAQLAEAESTARRQVDSERRRLETEVIELGSRREALLADVDGLERFESEYRARLRRALEADLESLAGKGPVAPSARPPIHEVDLPAASTPASSPPPAPPLSATPQTPQPPSTDAGPPTAEIRGLGTWDLPSRAPDAPSAAFSTPQAASPDASPSSDAPAPEAEAARSPLFPAESTDSEPLDDEAFFASLREAVSDQSPLGPRDEVPDSTGSYEDDDAKSGLFRRRR